MVILGLILVLVAIVLGAALILGTSAPDVTGQEVDLQFFDAVTLNLNPLTLVIAGMATMFLLWFGLILIRSALVHRKAQRRLRKEQEAAARERREQDEAAHQDELRLREEELHRRDAGADGHPDAVPDPTRPAILDGDAGATRPIRQGDPEDSGATRPIRRDGV